jgi:hypothetical protein
MKRLSEAAVQELNALVEASGLLTPAAVLERAEDKRSALHPLFTWDTKKAAHLRRLDEARAIIMMVRVRLEVQPDRPPINVRAFVSLADDRVAGGGYRPITVVLADPSQRAQLLRTAVQELGALQKKYAQLSELAQVFAALDDVQVAKTG